jgi:hypothetical protein
MSFNHQPEIEMIVKAKAVWSRQGQAMWISGYQVVHPGSGRLMPEVSRSQVHQVARRLAGWKRIRVEFF